MVEVMLKFVKMHGLGNDYIVIGLFDRSNSKAFGAIGDLPGFAKRLCDRHFGIGADGLLLVMPPVAGKNSGRIRIINPDGTEAEMCGNGIRCAAKFLLDSGLGAGKVLGIETLSGVKHVVADGRLYRVDMGEPRLERREIPMNGNGSARAVREPLQLKYRKVMITAVSMGNPHAVVFVDDNRIDLDAFDIEEMGREIECNPVFPRRANVEFVRVANRGEIEMRVWERGVGETLACGTGSCASVVACVLNELTERKVRVRLRGGDLTVEWARDNHVFLTGPATSAFNGWIGIS